MKDSLRCERRGWYFSQVRRSLVHCFLLIMICLTTDITDYIPDYCYKSTRAALKAEMGKSPKNDPPGFVYAFQIRGMCRPSGLFMHRYPSFPISRPETLHHQDRIDHRRPDETSRAMEERMSRIGAEFGWLVAG